MNVAVLVLTCWMGLPWAACTPENALMTARRDLNDPWLCSRIEEQKAPREVSNTGTYDRIVCLPELQDDPTEADTADVTAESDVEPLDLTRALAIGGGK